MLEEEVYEVFEAKDAVQAKQIVARNMPELLLIDIYLPQQSGLELLKELRFDFPDLQAVVLSQGSSLSGFNALEWAKNCGAVAALNKPINSGELLELVRTVLEKNRQD